MKLSLALIFSIVFGVGLVTLVFAVFQISNERSELENELESRLSRIADELSYDSSLFDNSLSEGDKEFIIDSLASGYHLTGI